MSAARILFALPWLLALVLVCAAPAQAARRTALVIGNGAYETVPLKNPVNDARGMAETLHALGFEVIHLENASRAVMQDAVDTLARQLSRGGVGVFYFAGHGVQRAGRNYLIPVNSGINAESDLESKAVDAGLVLESMEKAGNDLNIVILDACRNNPFAKKFRSAGGPGGGLAPMQAPKGSLIAFATSPGSVASDGAGDHGVYTKYLLENLRTPGLPVEQMFKRVRSGVVEETRNQQLPWETTSIQGDFSFAEQVAPGPVQAQAVAVPEPRQKTPASQKTQARSEAIQVEFAMLREHGNKPPLPVKSGDTMKSGESYLFHIKASSECYLYLFQVDATGRVFRLFPNEAYHTVGNPIPGSVALTLPNEGEVFYLDQTKGKEEFYFLASRESLAALEDLDGGGVDGIMRAGMTLRGPAGVKAAMAKVATGAGGQATAQVQEFSFANSFVHALTINHR